MKLIPAKEALLRLNYTHRNSLKAAIKHYSLTLIKRNGRNYFSEADIERA